MCQQLDFDGYCAPGGGCCAKGRQKISSFDRRNGEVERSRMWSATAEKVLKIGRFWCHFGSFAAPLLSRAGKRRAEMVIWAWILGSKKSKILKFSGIAPNRLGMGLGCVWGGFGAILGIWRPFGSAWRSLDAVFVVWARLEAGSGGRWR